MLSTSVLDSLTDAVAILSPVVDGSGAVVDLQIDYANQRALDVIGATEEAVGRSTWRTLRPVVDDSLYEVAITVARSGAPAAVDNVATRLVSGGHGPVVDLRLSAWEGRVVLVGRDISSRESVLVELRQSEARFRAVTDHLHDLVVIVVDESMRWRLLTGSALARSGWRAEALLGRTLGETLSPRLARLLRRHITAVLGGATRMFLLEGRDEHDHPTGILWDCEVVPVHTEGRITAALALVRDVTERMRDEERLRESDARHRAIAANLPDFSILFFDRDLRCQLVYGSALEQVGWQVGDVIGYRPSELLPPELAGEIEAYARAALAGAASVHEHRASHRPAVTMRNEFVPVRGDDGKIIAGMMIIRDVTAARRADQERAELLFAERSARRTAEAAADRRALLSEVARIFAMTTSRGPALTQLARALVPRLAVACIIDTLESTGDLSVATTAAVAHVNPTKQRLWQELRVRYPSSPPFGSAEADQRSAALPQPSPALLDELAVDDRHRDLLQQAGLGPSISAPLTARGLVLGRLTLVRALGEPAYGYDDVAFVEELADTAGLALDNLVLTEQLRHQALHDPLTGLANRGLLYDRLHHALSRSSRTGTLPALLFVDLDDFKRVNDTCGHQGGDLVLVETARRLSRHLRAADTAARLGGDEFVLLCEDLDDSTEALRIAERVVVDVAQEQVVVGTQVRVTGSVGVTVARGPTDTPDQLLREADEAMYAAKQLGANRVMVFDPTSGTPTLPR